MIPELLTGEPSLVVERIHELPTLPDIYQRLSSTIDKPFSSIWEIERIVRQDPVITARLLHFVNSPLYGLEYSSIHCRGRNSNRWIRRSQTIDSHDKCHRYVPTRKRGDLVAPSILETLPWRGGSRTATRHVGR